MVFDLVKPPTNPAPEGKISDKTLKGFTIEFSPEGDKVLNTWARNEGQGEFTWKTINFKEFYYVYGDLLVSVIGKRKPVEVEEGAQKGGPEKLQKNNTEEETKEGEKEKIIYGLGLWDKELNLLDQNFEYELEGLNKILTVDYKFVVAKGAKKNLVFYMIDPKAKKINPKKNNSIPAQWVSEVKKQEEYPKEFRCKAKSLQKDEILLLKFNALDEAWTDSYDEERVYN